MVNVNMLRAQMVLKGIKVSELASKMGYSKVTMYRKFKYPEKLMLGEIEQIAEILQIEKPCDIFFARK